MQLMHWPYHALSHMTHIFVWMVADVLMSLWPPIRFRAVSVPLDFWVKDVNGSIWNGLIIKSIIWKRMTLLQQKVGPTSSVSRRLCCLSIVSLCSVCFVSFPCKYQASYGSIDLVESLFNVIEFIVFQINFRENLMWLTVILSTSVQRPTLIVFVNFFFFRQIVRKLQLYEKYCRRYLRWIGCSERDFSYCNYDTIHAVTASPDICISSSIRVPVAVSKELNSFCHVNRKRRVFELYDRYSLTYAQWILENVSHNCEADVETFGTGQVNLKFDLTRNMIIEFRPDLNPNFIWKEWSVWAWQIVRSPFFDLNLTQPI